MKLALLLLTPLLLIGVIDGNTLELEQKAQKFEFREEIITTPTFLISKEDMEAQKLKYEENMNLLYKQAQLWKNTYLMKNED